MKENNNNKNNNITSLLGQNIFVTSFNMILFME